MKVYIVSAKFPDGFVVLPICYTTEDLAKRSVDGRTGRVNTWTEHNSHGHTWMTDLEDYMVEELEVRGS